MTRTTKRYSLASIIAVLLIVGLAAPVMAQPYSRRPNPQGSPSRSLEPAQPPARTGDEVVLEVGDDFASVIATQPPGTHFRIAEGVHVGQQIRPRDGDTFTGDAGAILSGAVPMAAGEFTRRGDVWVATGQTEEAFIWNGTFHGEMRPGFERDGANHDLWAGDTRLRHAASRSEVDTEGEWFFDYDADEIVIGRDPAATPIALATPWYAIASDASDVTVQHLTISRYATYAQHGAIHTTGPGWDIRHVTVTENHGAGITINGGTTVTDSLITWNGQIGLTAWSGEDIVVERNEIAHNYLLGYNWEWEGGGTKFKETTGMVFTNNWVHDNYAPGVWFDIDNRDSVITSNLIHDNLVGILMEISYGAEIAHNTIHDNGADGYGDLGAGIWVSNTSDVHVHDNAFADNRSDVIATQFERGSGAYGRYMVTGLNVHDNTFTISGPVAGPNAYLNNTTGTLQDRISSVVVLPIIKVRMREWP